MNGRFPLELRRDVLRSLGELRRDSRHLIFQRQKPFIRNLFCLAHGSSTFLQRIEGAEAKRTSSSFSIVKFCSRYTVSKVGTTQKGRKKHGVEIKPVDINNSFWDNVMEKNTTGALDLRLGFRQIRSMKKIDSEIITNLRGNGYQTIEDVWRRGGIKPHILHILANADVFASLNISRRQAIWQVKAVKSTKILPLFSQHWQNELLNEPSIKLPEMTLGENVVEDYFSLKLSLRAHPVALLRHKLTPGYPAIKGAPI